MLNSSGWTSNDRVPQSASEAAFDAMGLVKEAAMLFPRHIGVGFQLRLQMNPQHSSFHRRSSGIGSSVDAYEPMLAIALLLST